MSTCSRRGRSSNPYQCEKYGLALILTTRGFSLMTDYAWRLIPPEVIVRPLVDEPHPIPLVIAYRPKSPTPARFLVKAITADWRPD
jgi:LysR family hca operon transcriptional activator